MFWAAKTDLIIVWLLHHYLLVLPVFFSPLCFHHALMNGFFHIPSRSLTTTLNFACKSFFLINPGRTEHHISVADMQSERKGSDICLQMGRDTENRGFEQLSNFPPPQSKYRQLISKYRRCISQFKNEAHYLKLDPYLLCREQVKVLPHSGNKPQV